MTNAAILLAYREPQEPLRFYSPDEQSNAIFCFADFRKETILRIAMNEGPRPAEHHFHYSRPQEIPSQFNQTELLERTIESLKKGAGAKVVISRFHQVETNLDPLTILDRLDKEYPQATVYCFSHPEAGTWIGASPERLFSCRNGQVRIDSLAGTRQWNHRDSFGDKEFEEQGIVTKDIITKLSKVASLEGIKIGPRNLKRAGNLAHLHNEISAKMKAEDGISQLLASIPPTPAVGGKPEAWALAYIAEKELYDRRFYTGYFGWEWPQKQEASFWVNLRCAEWIDGPNLAVYVGGGITAESVAVDEWLETEHKAQTILKVLD